MAYPYVQAFHDYGPRKGPVLGFVVHMAEGGGTVGYLSRETARGVSVHYVIEYSGRTVQMLREDHASGSINPNDIRTGNDPDGFFGRSDANAVLGVWVTDPNSVTVTVEVEGFAAAGPNATQNASLARLARDVATRHPVRNLGHRDFQDYKACPGRLIPWADMGGHGLPAGGSDVRFANSNGYAVTSRKRLALKAGQAWTFLDGSAGWTFSADAAVDCLGLADSKSGAYVVEIATGTPYADKIARRTLVMVKTATLPVDVPPPAPVDCTTAVAAETKRVKLAAVAAIGGIK